MRGTWIKVLGILLVIAVIAASVSAQTAYQQLTSLSGPNFYGNFSGNFLGAGARSQGMGGAFIAVSDDISAVTWNPAGLLGSEKPVLGISFGSLRPRGSFSDRGPLVFNGAYDIKAEQAGSLSNLEYLGFLSPMRIRGHQFVFSGAYSRQFEDFGTSHSEFDAVLPYFDQYGPIPDSLYEAQVVTDVEKRATPYAVNIGFGTRLYGSLNVGFAINVYSGKQYNRADDHISVAEYNAPNLLGNQTVRLDQYLGSLDTFTFSGTNFTLGAKGTAGKFNYGATIRSGFDLKLKGGVTLLDTVKYNGRPQPDQSATIYGDNMLVKMSIPWTISGGVAYKATENLLLAGDLEYRPYSGKLVNRRDSTRIRSGQDNEDFFTTIDPGWFNCFGFRTGLEYSWHTGKTLAPIVPLRLGLGYMTVPAPSYDKPSGLTNVTQNEVLSQVTTSSTAQFSLSAGAGVYWSQIHLDLAYSYSSLGRNEIGFFYVSPFLPPVASYGELKTRNHNLTMSFTGYF